MSRKNTAQPLSSKFTGSSNLNLTAAALQDHWSRTLSLGPHFGPRKIGLRPAARAKQNQEVKSLIDTGKPREKMKKEKEEKEYVLDAKLPPLTLAQKFGLVYAPKPLLSEQEWANVKAKSNQRDDSKEPCVICKEDFGVQDQVLLSCTHVFHKACLQALERFTGRKSCPMCRHTQYQTRVIQEGARIHKHKCATRIQSLWRGYVVRCWYKQLRQTVPPKDPMLRKKFYEEKLSAIVDRIVKSIDVNIAEFMREIDNSVQQSRAIFSQWDNVHNEISLEHWESIQLKAVERGETDCPICLTELYLSDGLQRNSCLTTDPESTINNNSSQSYRVTCSDQNSFTVRKNSQKVKEFAKKATDGQSAITTPLNKRLRDNNREKYTSSEASLNCCIPTSTNSGDTEQLKCVRSTVLLSCTHVFHSTCLNTLEEIAMQDMKNTCPVCRAYYQKTIIVF